MAHAQSHAAASVAPFGAIAIFRVISSVEAVVDGVRAWRSARKNAKALADLTFSQLEDIGVTRTGSKFRRTSFR